MSATRMTLTAMGKQIATIDDYFDGTNGGEKTNFARSEIYTGQRLEDVKYAADFYGFLDWKTGTASAEFTRMQKVGDEDAYIVRLKPEKANPVTFFHFDQNISASETDFAHRFLNFAAKNSDQPNDVRLPQS